MEVAVGVRAGISVAVGAGGRVGRMTLTGWVVAVGGRVGCGWLEAGSEVTLTTQALKRTQRARQAVHLRFFFILPLLILAILLIDFVAA